MLNASKRKGEGIIRIIDILHHFLHLNLFANTQAIVDRRNMQTCLEDNDEEYL